MSHLPVVSGRDAIKAFNQIGYGVHRQRGSHIVLRGNAPPYRRLVVPDHAEIAKGTLRSLIRHAGLSVEEFTELL